MKTGIVLSSLAVILLGTAHATGTEESMTVSQANDILADALSALKRVTEKSGRRLRSEEDGKEVVDNFVAAMNKFTDNEGRHMEENNPENFAPNLKELISNVKHSTK